MCGNNVVSGTGSEAATEFKDGLCPSENAGGGAGGGKTTDDLISDAQKNLNPANLKNPQDLVNRAIKLLMAFVGTISLVMYIVAGILWMFAAGNTERVTTAKKVIVWTTLGLLVMFFSYVLVNFVFNAILK